MSLSTKLNALLRVAVFTRTEDKEMPLSRLQILLLVAKAGDEGALVRGLIKTSDINQSSVSRSLRNLGATESGGLVVQKRDPEDPRRVRIYITDRGRAFLSNIESIMD